MSEPDVGVKEEQTPEEKIATLERANSGLYAEVREERGKRQEIAAELRAAQARLAGAEAEKQEALRLAHLAWDEVDRLKGEK